MHIRVTNFHNRVRRTRTKQGRYYVPIDLRSAISELDQMLSLQYKVRFLLKRTSHASEHFGLGMWIRNCWLYTDVPQYPRLRRTWHKPNRYRKGHLLKSPKKRLLYQNFVRRGVRSPDSMSGFILRAYEKHLRGIRIVREPGSPFKKVKLRGDYGSYKRRRDAECKWRLRPSVIDELIAPDVHIN